MTIFIEFLLAILAADAIKAVAKHAWARFPSVRFMNRVSPERSKDDPLGQRAQFAQQNTGFWVGRRFIGRTKRIAI